MRELIHLNVISPDEYKMGFSSGILVTFRIWLARLFGFQTLKMSDRFSKNETPARYYSLLLIVLITILEGSQVTFGIEPWEFKTETEVAIVILSLTGAIAAISAILSDTFIHANEKVILYNNFQKINDIFLEEKFNISTALGRTNSVFVMLVTLKVFQSAFVTCFIDFGLYIMYVIVRKFVLSLMTLQILTEIGTCESHVKCIREKFLWSHCQQVSAQNEIDFGATSFKSSEQKEIRTLKENHKSTTKVQMNVYALINANLKLISKRFKYAVNIIYLLSVNEKR